MELRVFGSGNAFGDGGRFQACFGLRHEGTFVLLDAGATTLHALAAQGVEPLEVDAVVISHLHGDHFGGLPFLMLDAKARKRTRPLHVLGPPGVAERLAAAGEALYPGSLRAAMPYPLTVTELVPSGPAVPSGPMRVRAVEVDHRSGAPSLALRVSLGGREVGYSGDTAWTDSLLQVSEGADLFLLECTSWQTPVPFHVCHRDVVANAHRLGAGRSLLTHMSRDVLAHLDETALPTAWDGMSLEL